MGDLGVDRWVGAPPQAQDARRDREAFVPRRGGAQPVLGSPGVAAPEVFKGCHRPAELGRCAEQRGRRDRIQPDLEQLADSPASRPEVAGQEPDDDTAVLVPAMLTPGNPTDGRGIATSTQARSGDVPVGNTCPI
ncbi:hypothetical protein [Nonomuraea rhodomycinica]|uniref:Uncharacterized protein n=1 Tax=Nonomuraea rhodomycinica TaxID=1712872 RepID=A0A7Y6IRV7_9ACTN|nr:hypothetical protein [Nonomuraea rhodomycinica]NUW41979.1 hypothetical protein [Nonomuraea rhodomycinica]